MSNDKGCYSGRMIKLYHYVHCPFCVRVRMGLGFLKLSFQSEVLAYDEEKIPINLTGVKMLPIVQDEQGQTMNESLDILQKYDQQKVLNFSFLENHKEEINTLLDSIGSPVHNLAMPYWIYTPEFDSKSRQYFQTKKEKKRGPFFELVKKEDQFTEEINFVLKALESSLTPFYKSDRLTIVDIMIAAHLWGLYVVPEFQFDGKTHQYLQTVKSLCDFNYHEDFWRMSNFKAKRSE